MFAAPVALVSARCYVGHHHLCVAERCDCDCHVPIIVGNSVWNREGFKVATNGAGKSLS